MIYRHRDPIARRSCGTPRPRGSPVSQISVQNVSKYWGATRAVESVSFDAAEAALVVLLGPSGCGKSTTPRLIAGLEHVTSGRILIAGKDVTALPPAKRRISMVFQTCNALCAPAFADAWPKPSVQPIRPSGIRIFSRCLAIASAPVSRADPWPPRSRDRLHVDTIAAPARRRASCPRRPAAG
jgi:hypothetical protein